MRLVTQVSHPDCSLWLMQEAKKCPSDLYRMHHTLNTPYIPALNVEKKSYLFSVVSNLKQTPICVDVLLMCVILCVLVWPVQFSMEIGKLFIVAKPAW